MSINIQKSYLDQNFQNINKKYIGFANSSGQFLFRPNPFSNIHASKNSANLTLNLEAANVENGKPKSSTITQSLSIIRKIIIQKPEGLTKKTRLMAKNKFLPVGFSPVFDNPSGQKKDRIKDQTLKQAFGSILISDLASDITNIQSEIKNGQASEASTIKNNPSTSEVNQRKRTFLFSFGDFVRTSAKPDRKPEDKRMSGRESLPLLMHGAKKPYGQVNGTETKLVRVFKSSYKKTTEINLITISLASANRIRQWAEKTLPNGKIVGEVINPETVHYKTLKPIKGGLFCERIFGPLKDFECACGTKISPMALGYLTVNKSKSPKNSIESTAEKTEKAYSDSTGEAPGWEKSLLKKRYFCRICDVEYTYSIIRRTQLGYIQLASPTTHVWFVKGLPSYISILLDIKKKDLQSIIYNTETLNLEHALRGPRFLPSSPKAIFLAWQNIMKIQYPEKFIPNTDKPNATSVKTNTNIKKNKESILNTSFSRVDQPVSLWVDEEMKKSSSYPNTFFMGKPLKKNNTKLNEPQENLRDFFNVFDNSSGQHNYKAFWFNSKKWNKIKQKVYKYNKINSYTTKKKTVFNNPSGQQEQTTKNTQVRLPFLTFGRPVISSQRLEQDNLQRGKKVEHTSRPNPSHFFRFSSQLKKMDTMLKSNVFPEKKTNKKNRRNLIELSPQVKGSHGLNTVLNGYALSLFGVKRTSRYSQHQDWFKILFFISKFLVVENRSNQLIEKKEKKNNSIFHSIIGKHATSPLVRVQDKTYTKSTVYIARQNPVNYLLNFFFKINKVKNIVSISPLGLSFLQPMLLPNQRNTKLLIKFSKQPIVFYLLMLWTTVLTGPEVSLGFYRNYCSDAVKNNSLTKKSLFLNEQRNKGYSSGSVINILKHVSLKLSPPLSWSSWLVIKLKKKSKVLRPLARPLFLSKDLNNPIEFKYIETKKYFNKSYLKFFNSAFLNLSLEKLKLQEKKQNLPSNSLPPYSQELKVNNQLSTKKSRKAYTITLMKSISMLMLNFKKLLFKKTFCAFTQPFKIFSVQRFHKFYIKYLLNKACLMYKFALSNNKTLCTDRPPVFTFCRSSVKNTTFSLRTLFLTKLSKINVSFFYFLKESQKRLVYDLYFSLLKDFFKIQTKHEFYVLITFTLLSYKQEVSSVSVPFVLTDSTAIKTQRPFFMGYEKWKSSSTVNIFYSRRISNYILINQDFWTQRVGQASENTTKFKQVRLVNLFLEQNKKIAVISGSKGPEVSPWTLAKPKKISNNIYCLSHRELWDQEKDWQDFAYYYYSPTQLTDLIIPLYENRSYDLLFNFDRTQISLNNYVSENGININTSFSGAGLIQKLLNDMGSISELKKIDQQNRILLFEYNKHLKKLKQKKKNLKVGKISYHKACQIRDLLIRRTKLTRKIQHSVNESKSSSNNLFSLTTANTNTSVNNSLNVDNLSGQTSVTKNFLNTINPSEGWSTQNSVFSSSNSFAGNMILTILPVLPPVLRPVLKMSGQFTISDLNRLYQRIIYRNERLKKFLKDPALSSSFEMKYAQRLLQEAVDNLIQNGKSGVVPEKDARGRLLKSLSDILKGKQGRFRQYLLGKRVDYSGRSVIVVGPRLKLHECGIPKEMAVVLYSPFLIKRILNEKLADTYLSAKKLLKTKPLLVSQLLREIMRVCPVLLNRAPTLHRLGFQAFQPKLVDGKAILLHPLVCPAFNADFDGDQMAVHIPITFEARAEAWKLMLARNNLKSPATGEPLILPSQDMVLGCYYLTTNCAEKNMKFKMGSGMYFTNLNDVLKLYNQHLIHVHAVIWVNLTNRDIVDNSMIFNTTVFDNSSGHYQQEYYIQKPTLSELQIANITAAEQPLEIRIPLFYMKKPVFGNPSGSKNQRLLAEGLKDSGLIPIGNYLEILKSIHNIVKITNTNQIIYKIIKTTPGKIAFNIIIKNAIEKQPKLLWKHVYQKGSLRKQINTTIDLHIGSANPSGQNTFT